jgi:hypothetical protein
MPNKVNTDESSLFLAAQQSASKATMTQAKGTATSDCVAKLQRSDDVFNRPYVPGKPELPGSYQYSMQ